MINHIILDLENNRENAKNYPVLKKIGWRGGDNLHILDFVHNQPPTVGAKHKINDFCFLNFFILMKITPYQGQKIKLTKERWILLMNNIY